ncbi:sigma-70 family RNA polymerase sigma factor [Gemmata sp. JC673]|uniref:Sigma-70 family RNA polymerase sigma factor n=1 Tax=Gemmata algarum TaxID=2975278 RepID=A0ABU5F171_9BACT|nr:sigma-70 family RNA polymerase sigma factor [Gemmata algarum]MDY3560873.1 sigma-70 family RNA polymerase sigma factor [Gemmata algarum]
MPGVEIDRQRVQWFVAAHANTGASDRELLRRFADRRDEAAFAALVRRHGAMVLATGHRVLGRSPDAEDVFQATFLLLSRKAGSGRWHPSVASWLHRVAHLLALKVRRAATRRARHEERAPRRTAPDPLDEMSGRELLAVLDEELLALPEVLRAPLVLCALEGASRAEAAERLGCTPATLKKRLELGRRRLRDALTRRRIGLPALLGTLLLGSSAVAVPNHLVQAVVRATLATGGPGLSSQVGELVHGGIGMTGWNKFRVALGAALLCGCLAVVGALAARPGSTPEEPPKTAAPAERAPEPPAVEAMRVVVLDSTGKPLPGANVHAGIWTDEEGFPANRDIETDAAGAARVPLPKTFTILRLWAGKKSFATLFANWERSELASGKGVPAEYTFRLESAVTAGGRIVDEKGKPVTGARVEVRLENALKPAGSDGRVRYNGWIAESNDAPTTDTDGRWRVDGVPDHPEVELSLLATHPDFATDKWERSAKSAGITLAALRNGTAALALKAGVRVRGTVTAPDGKPIKDALVIHGDAPSSGRVTSTFATGTDGTFRLPALAPGKTSLTVIAPGWAPQLRTVELKADMPAQDFRMAAGKSIRLRVVDEAGKPVPRAYVTLHEWKGSESIYSEHNTNYPKVPGTGIPRRTDANGVWEWRSAPDEPVKVRVDAVDHVAVELDVTGGTTDRTVELKAEPRVTGTVTDAVTGKPIPRFTVTPVSGFSNDAVSAWRGAAVLGREGQFQFRAVPNGNSPLRWLRVEAPGYRTQDGPELLADNPTSQKQDFKLVPSRMRTGVITDTAGKPVAKAQVQIATPTEQATLSKNGLDYCIFTDAQGRFEFPDPGEPWAVVAQSEAGIAVAECPADQADAGTLKLQPWGAVRGTFRDGGKPIAGATVFATPIRIQDRTRPLVFLDCQAITDAEGRFELPRVPPGPVCVQVSLGPWNDPGFRSGPSVPLALKPGTRTDLGLGSGGATLTGRVKLTGKIPADLDCTYSLNFLVRREPGIVPPPEVAAAGFDARNGWRDTWRQTSEGLAYLSTLQAWFVKLAPDGTFRVSGVPAGEYDLAVAVYAKPSGCLIDPLARRVVRVTVTAADAARGELKVPEVTAEVEPIPVVGDTPALAFERADGKTGTLADCRGRYTVVHFWASWCAPCKKQLPALKALHERFAARGLTTLSLSLDDESAPWRAALKELALPWAQGRLGAKGASGVSGVPAYWLLDPTGKLMAKGDTPDELIPVLEERLKRTGADR